MNVFLEDEDRDALINALTNYLNGNGMEDKDDDEVILDKILDRL